MKIRTVQDDGCLPKYLVEIGTRKIHWNKPWGYGPHWYYHPRSGGAWCALFPGSIAILAFIGIVLVVGEIVKRLP
jgi:hypothetical protein